MLNDKQMVARSGFSPFVAWLRPGESNARGVLVALHLITKLIKS